MRKACRCLPVCTKKCCAWQVKAALSMMRRKRWSGLWAMHAARRAAQSPAQSRWRKYYYFDSYPRLLDKR